MQEKILSDYLRTRKASGELVDLYQSKWVKKRYRNFMKTYDGNLEENYLMLALDQYQRETIALLPVAFPNTGKCIEESLHKPDFLILNMKTSQVLAFGLGRKNREFMFAVDEDPTLESTIDTVDHFLESRSSYKVRFTALDKAGVVIYILQRFQELSAAWEEWGNVTTVDDEEDLSEVYTAQDLSRIRRAEAAWRRKIKRAEHPFRALFADCECLSWELDTGDFPW